MANRNKAPRRNCALRVPVNRSDQRFVIYSPSIWYHAYGVNDIIGVTMQPSEQNQNQQPPVAPAPNPAQPLPYAVPEYLHLDPVTGQAKRSFKKPVLITLGVLLLVSILGFIGYQVWQYNQPQARFYRALGNNLSVTDVERKYVAAYQGFTYSNKLQADVKTDFTNPASPKSLASYQYTENNTIYNADYVMPGGEKYLALVHDGLPKSAGLVSNKWYQMTFNSAGTADVQYSLDKLPIKQLFNTPQNLLPIGNFSASQRSQLMDYIKAHTVYTVTGSQTQQGVTTYTITLKIDALNGLNKEIATMLGAQQVYVASAFFNNPSQLTVMIDDKTGKLKQTSYKVPNGSDFLFQGTVDYSYPTTLSIEAPNGATSLSGGINL